MELSFCLSRYSGSSAWQITVAARSVYGIQSWFKIKTTSERQSLISWSLQIPACKKEASALLPETTLSGALFEFSISFLSRLQSPAGSTWREVVVSRLVDGNQSENIVTSKPLQNLSSLHKSSIFSYFHENGDYTCLTKKQQVNISQRSNFLKVFPGRSLVSWLILREQQRLLLASYSSIKSSCVVLKVRAVWQVVDNGTFSDPDTFNFLIIFFVMFIISTVFRNLSSIYIDVGFLPGPCPLIVLSWRTVCWSLLGNGTRLIGESNRILVSRHFSVRVLNQWEICQSKPTKWRIRIFLACVYEST